MKGVGGGVFLRTDASAGHVNNIRLSGQWIDIPELLPVRKG